MKKIELPTPELRFDPLKPKSKPTNWVPVYWRLKIKPDPDSLSSIIDVRTSDTFQAGVIVAMGPLVGTMDGKKIHDFRVGQRVLYQRMHAIAVKGPDGDVQHFIKEDATHALIAVADESEDSNV